MCSGFPHTHKSSQPPQETGLSQSNSLLNDRYRILKPLGQGTFLVIDEQDSRNDQDLTSFEQATSKLCVIKKFLPQCQTFHHNQKTSELFHQETLRLTQLGKHPQIPQLLNTFEQDDKKYLVQEWIDGQTLEQEFVEAGAFNELKIRKLLGDLLPVLQFIHAHQVIHRDIKPSNIIRCQSNVYGRQGQLFLVDFADAKYIPSNCEQTGTIIGSPEYAAPEHIRGKAVFASDLYSLGLTCLYLLTQMSPFELYDCSEDVWIWRSYLIEPISPSLEKILAKLVQPATKLRYQFAAEVLIDLNNSSNHFGGSLGGSANTNIDDELENPYFGLKREADLLASIYLIKDSSVTSVTIFDPKTQTWHYLLARNECSELARKVAAFLTPRPDAATPVKVSRKIMRESNKISQVILTAIALTVACLVWGLESNSTYTHLKFELVRTFQELLNVGR